MSRRQRWSPAALHLAAIALAAGVGSGQTLWAVAAGAGALAGLLPGGAEG